MVQYADGLSQDGARDGVKQQRKHNNSNGALCRDANIPEPVVTGRDFAADQGAQDAFPAHGHFFLDVGLSEERASAAILHRGETVRALLKGRKRLIAELKKACYRDILIRDERFNNFCIFERSCPPFPRVTISTDRFAIRKAY